MNKKKTRFNKDTLIDNRQIRIFLSSTFADMQEERSALVKTFNKLKIEAAQRNVTLSLLDLRWGVTESEARSGKVVSLCLKEIEHSHPFFIGILGDRYGTSPDPSELTKNPELKELYPWIEQDIANGLSITEIEIQYGVLRNHVDVDAAFFIKKNKKNDDDWKLTRLKNTIRDQSRYHVDEYSMVEELCLKVEKVVRAILNKHFPDNELTELEILRNAQKAFINNRHAYYLEQTYYYDFLDDFVSSKKSYLALIGRSGIGKSALLANWIKSNEDNDDFNLIYYFVDNPFSDNGYEVILRYLCDEIYYLYCIHRFEEFTQNVEEEMQQLINIVASREQPLVIVIDGINRLNSTNDEKLLFWIPDANEKVKFIFSTLKEDETIHFFEDRNYDVKAVLPLGREERSRFIVEYLETVGKHLEIHQLNRIVDDAESQNTLVLKSLLDELICFGNHNRLDEIIDYYLAATTISEFFDKVLSRMEKDYSAGQSLVSHALILISISEHGLSEEEVGSILGCRQLDWQLFFCAFFNYFVIKNGLISFSHQHVIDAVAKRYHIDDAEKINHYRHEIIDYFLISRSEPRSISELTYQYFKLEDWDNLYHVLMDYNTFDYLFSSTKLLELYWRTLIDVNRTKYKLTDYIRLLPQEESVRAKSLSNLGELAGCISEYSLAIEFFESALKIKKILYGNEHHPSVADLLEHIGCAYADKGEYDQSLEYYFKALNIRKGLYGEDHPVVKETYRNIIAVYSGQDNVLELSKYITKLTGSKETLLIDDEEVVGYLYYRQGNYTRALECLYDSFSKRKKKYGMDDPTTIHTYMCIGQVYEGQENYPKALEIFLDSAALLEKVRGTKHRETADAYSLVGEVLRSQGDSFRAVEYYQKALSIREKRLGTDHPATFNTYKRIGEIFCEQGDWDKAIEYLTKAVYAIKRKLGEDHPYLTNVYYLIGCAYNRQRKYHNALEFLIAGSKIEKGDSEMNAHIYEYIGSIYVCIGEYDNALEYDFKALEIIKNTFGEDSPNTSVFYESIGYIYNSLGERRKASEYYVKAFNARGDQWLSSSLTADTLNNIGLAHFISGDFSAALNIYFEELRTREENFGEGHLTIATTNNDIGFAYYRLENYSEAINYLNKALRMKEKLLGKMHVSTAFTYNLVGAAFLGLGDCSKALKYFELAIDIFEKLDPNNENIPIVREYINITKCRIKDVPKKRN